MPSHVRQHKSPYFYVQKGSGFVLLDNHEETQTRYKTEAEAKRAVLSLNDAWRAKGAKSNPRRRNPAPTRAEIVDRADASIENGMGSVTMTALEDMLDGYDGDNIRAQFYVGWRDSDLQALLDELGTRNVRRRNPRKYDESKDGAGYRKLSDLKKGEFFKRKPTARLVYTKGDYVRSEKKFSCMDEDNISREILLKGDTLVYVGFDY